MKVSKICRPLLYAFTLLFSLMNPILLLAEDVGHIALVEDTDGSIHAMPAAAMPNIYLAKIACAFYTDHPDEFDAIFVFDAEILGMANIQQGWPVQSAAEGIGRGMPDQTDGFCSSVNHRLRQAVKMGSIDSISGLPDNPDDKAPIVLFYPLTGIELLAHEFGHQWLASVNFDKGDGTNCLLRGYEPSGGSRAEDPCDGYNQHWSYNYNSCSLMYGSCIEDLGAGNFNYTYPLGVVKYSQLDQYLMGLRLPADVEPMFLVDVGSEGDPSIPMQHDGSREHSGTRVDFSIEDVIREMGPRVPELENCHWKGAFIITYLPERPPPLAYIEKVERYRKRWEEFYSWSTDNRGSFDTRLDGCGTGTASCQGEVSEQCGSAPDGDAEACVFGDTRCASLTSIEVCSPEGEWEELTICDEDWVCKGGECVQIFVDGDQAADGDEAQADGDEPPLADGDDPIKTDGDAPLADGDETPLPEDPCTAKETRCKIGIFQECDFVGDWQDMEDCGAAGLICTPETGCEEDDGSGATGGGCTALPSRSGLFALLLTVLTFLALRRRNGTQNFN